MASKSVSNEQGNTNTFSNLGLKIQGDIGHLQIDEKSDSELSDDNETTDENVKPQTVATIACIPSSLIQPAPASVLSNVCVTNSDNVQFGNNTYFHGPVTIKQIIKKKGIDNPSYTSTDNENETSSPTRDKTKNSYVAPKKSILSIWHKMLISVASVFLIGVICVLAIIIPNNIQEDKGASHAHPVSAEKDPLNFTRVVGMCYDNYQITIFTIVMVPVTIVLMLYSLLTTQIWDGGQSTDQKNNQNEDYVLDYPQADCNSSVEKHKVKDDPLLIAPYHLRIVSRSDWLAQPVEHELDKIKQPVPWVVITHTATEGCYSQSECVYRVRLIQMFHIESRDWDDIGYNFLVAGDGSAYFGRGWDYIGAHTLGYNRYSIGIAFVGTFNSETPPQKQIEACQKLIKLGVQLGKIRKDYKLFAHRQLASTLSPGDKLYEILKEWPHFVKEGTNITELIPKGY